MRKILMLGCLAIAFHTQANSIIKDKSTLFTYKKSSSKNSDEYVEKILLSEQGKIEYYTDKTYYISDTQDLRDNNMRISQYPNLKGVYIISSMISTDLIGEIGLIAPQLETFSLCDVTISNEKDIRALQNHLSAMKNIKTLTIAYVRESNGSTARIINSANISQLTELNIDNRSITQDDLNVLARSISQAENLRKLRLDIRSDADLSALIQALAANTNLNSLEIGVHPMAATVTAEDRNKGRAAEDIKRYQMQQMIKSIAKHTNLQQLTIRYAGQDANNFIAVFDEICKNCPLLKLDLSGFTLSKTAAIAVLRAMKNASQLRMLDLSGMQFNRDICLEFSKLMQGNKTLERLILDGCFPNISNGEINESSAIFEVLPWNTLQNLSICDNDFRNTNIDFAQYLQSLPVRINAYNCLFSAEALQNAIAHLCDANKSVLIDLRDSKIYNSTSNNTAPWSLAERMDFRDKITIKSRGKNTLVLGL